MQKKISLMLLAILSSSVISCAHKVPDVPVCVELSLTRGYCINTISSIEYEVNDTNKLEGLTWWEIREKMLMLPASSWAAIKKFIIEICADTKKCDSMITNWERTVKNIDGQMKTKP